MGQALPLGMILFLKSQCVYFITIISRSKSISVQDADSQDADLQVEGSVVDSQAVRESFTSTPASSPQPPSDPMASNVNYSQCGWDDL